MTTSDIDNLLAYDPIACCPVRSVADFGTIRVVLLDFVQLWEHALGVDFYMNALLLEFRNHGNYGEYPLSFYGVEPFRQMFSEAGFTGNLCDIKWLVWDMLAGMSNDFASLKNVKSFTGVFAFCIAMALEKQDKFGELEWFTLQRAFNIISKDLSPSLSALLNKNILWKGKYFWWLVSPKSEELFDKLLVIQTKFKRLPENNDEFMTMADNTDNKGLQTELGTNDYYPPARLQWNLSYISEFDVNYELFHRLNQVCSGTSNNILIEPELDYCCVDKTGFYEDKIIKGFSRFILNILRNTV
jgi:hypothetical protein